MQVASGASAVFHSSDPSKSIGTMRRPVREKTWISRMTGPETSAAGEPISTSWPVRRSFQAPTFFQSSPEAYSSRSRKISKPCALSWRAKAAA
jgi:hypothetical protein